VAIFGTNGKQPSVYRKCGRLTRWRHRHSRWVPNKIKMILVCSSQVVFGVCRPPQGRLVLAGVGGRVSLRRVVKSKGGF
jgi:hypothetical protein